MNNHSRYAIVLIVLVAASGCGSPTANLLSDGLNIINEVSDSLRKVVDEESAKYFEDARGKLLKEKWDTYQKRVEKWMKDHEAPDLQEAAWFRIVDAWLSKKNKQKGAISHILDRSGELDKHFVVWLNKKGVPTDQNTDTESAIAAATKKGVLQEMHTSAERWFKESFAATKNLKFAQERLNALGRKSQSKTVRDVAQNWSQFLPAQ